MKITFLGVGTAIDKKSTTSILVEGKANMLLDCGYGAVYNLWNYSWEEKSQ